MTLNLNNKIGIIGMGYVGKAVYDCFKDYYSHIHTYDIDETKSNCDSIDQLVHQSKVIFVALPTPMKNNGECDTSLIFEAISKINFISNEEKIIVLKSTVPPGTTEKLNKINNNISICFNPEFLTEKNFINDFKNQDRIILGGDFAEITLIKEMYKSIFKSIPIIITEPKVAETVKYLTNCFLALKVIFGNEIKELCDTADINYDLVVKYAILDSRLGDSHWNVPGPDGFKGFGGTCFPKDVNALLFFANKKSVKLDLLRTAWEKNLKIRESKDWENLIGRAVVDTLENS